MKRPVFDPNSRAVRSSDLFKYLLAKEKATATKVSQKRYLNALYKELRWIDPKTDLEVAIYEHNERNIAELRELLEPRLNRPFWPTL